VLRFLHDAEKELREALRLRPDLLEAHVSLGKVLMHQGKLPEAEKEFREALRLRPDDPGAHYNLGIFLGDQGKLAEAEKEYREALRLRPDYPEAHCNLGNALQRQGRFAESLDAYKRGHELGSQRPGWPYPSAGWVRHSEQLVALDVRLSQVLQGQVQPAAAAERIVLGWLCQQGYKKRYLAAARFYTEAFAAEPKLANDLGTSCRYNAARAAALAGCGQGADAASLDEKELARLRRQALNWLQTDLSAWGQLLKKEPVKARATVKKTLRHWRQDSDFDGVRGDALIKLPEAERQMWQQLWAAVEQMLKNASDKDAKDTNKNSPE
jgi:Tfp pilus assembly protein PilF